MKNYETERLFIREFNTEDAEFLLELYNMPKFIQFIGDRNIKTVEEAQQYIREKFRPQIDRLGFGNFVIMLKHNQQKIGTVGIFEREGLEIVDIGFSLLPEFEGKGYAYEAANRLKEIAATDWGIEKLSAITVKDNFATQKLIQRLGLQFKKMVNLPNDPEELLYYEN